ncbi:MAG: polysaccharide deacetylase family protein [Pontibacterium sp.]
MAIFFVFLTIGSALVAYELYLNYFPQESAYTGSTVREAHPQELVFLKSDHTIKKLNSFGLSEQNYLTRLQKFSDTYRKKGYRTRYIEESELPTLPSDTVLFALDTINLTDQALQDIQRFVRNGGFLMFNYHFAYHAGETYRNNAAIQEITGLKHPDGLSHVKSNQLLYVTPRILSPLSGDVYPKGARMGLELYDALPVFVSDNLEPDAIATNWAVTSPMTVTADNSEETNLSYKEAGVLWHGRYGRGNWVYSNLPSYSLFSSTDARDNLEQLLAGIAGHAVSPLTLTAYPYLNASQPVFISEDTEYKFESFRGFIDAANRYKVPVTAFLVASLAEQHQDLVGEADQSPYIELASHSYSHKKILGTGADNVHKETAGSKAVIESLAQAKVVTGFRPPREELDKLMLQQLAGADYSYILEKHKNFQYPTIENSAVPLYSIPRNATDDYQYLVNLDWDTDAIYRRMVSETNLISSIDGIYSLSIHTHLMAYKKNIQIIEKYFRYLNQHPELTPMTGSDLIRKVQQTGKLKYNVATTQKNFLIKVNNGNASVIDSVKFRAYWPAGKRLRTVKAEIIGSKIEYIHNEKLGHTDITLFNLKPKSTLSLIAEYL